MKWTVIALGTFLIGLAGTSVAAAPAMRDSTLTSKNTSIEQVKHRRGHHRDRDRRYRRGNVGAAVSGGLTQDPVIVAPLTNSATRQLRKDRDCGFRYFSYDASSGTYMGRDGFRHLCP